ncbi:MAG: winged helix-turn-helix domain-containing protein [Actinobacteria bacterium]|nr:winged helix-turn-helix domain-containing protein [Actinomycetota bacterium]
MLEFRLLGPLEAIADGRPLRLGPPQQRALLAALVLQAGSVVSVDSLIDAVWGDRPPESAANIVQSYVARLRRLLEPQRARGEPARLLLTRPPGYLLDLQPDQTDAGRFYQLVEAGRRSRPGDPATAAATLRDALADLRDVAVVTAAHVRLAELRRAALDERIDADLALGRDAELVPEDPVGGGGRRRWVHGRELPGRSRPGDRAAIAAVRGGSSARRPRRTRASGGRHVDGLPAQRARADRARQLRAPGRGVRCVRRGPAAGMSRRAHPGNQPAGAGRGGRGDLAGSRPGRAGGGAAVRRAGRGAVAAARRNRARRAADLPAAGRHAAGHRAGSRAHPDAVSERDRGPARRPVRVAGTGQPWWTGAAPHAVCRD